MNCPLALQYNEQINQEVKSYVFHFGIYTFIFNLRGTNIIQDENGYISIIKEKVDVPTCVSLIFRRAAWPLRLWNFLNGTTYSVHAAAGLPYLYLLDYKFSVSRVLYSFIIIKTGATTFMVNSALFYYLHYIQSPKYALYWKIQYHSCSCTIFELKLALIEKIQCDMRQSVRSTSLFYNHRVRYEKLRQPLQILFREGKKRGCIFFFSLIVQACANTRNGARGKKYTSSNWNGYVVVCDR